MANSSMLVQWVACGTIAIAGLGAIHPALRAQGTPGNSSSTVNRGNVPQAQAEQLFTDLEPSHWAYQALLNLVSTYGCVSGYPDGTFRGDAAVTRYEFAAGLESCLGATVQMLESHNDQQQEIDALIDAIEQSLQELRQLDQDIDAVRE